MKRLFVLSTLLFLLPLNMVFGKGGPPLTNKFLDIYTVHESDLIDRGASEEVFHYALCEFGDIAISGGYSLGGGGSGSANDPFNEITITSTGIGTLLQDPELYPDAPPDSFGVRAMSSSDFPEEEFAWRLHVRVYCVRNYHPHDGQY